MDVFSANALVQQLLKERPEEVYAILVKCCEYEKVRQEINYVLQSKDRKFEASLPGNKFDITFAPSPSTSVHNPHQIGSSLTRQRPPGRLSLNAPTYPFSPARTASSVTSHSTRDESGPGEWVLVPVFVGPSPAEKLIRMNTASIKYSVIREDVVFKRNLNAAYSLSPVEQLQIQVPCLATGDLQLVSVGWCIELTWRRRGSEATHSTMFYMVPKGLLELDMVLGSDDSGEDIQGVCKHFGNHDDDRICR